MPHLPKQRQGDRAVFTAGFNQQAEAARGHYDIRFDPKVFRLSFFGRHLHVSLAGQQVRRPHPFRLSKVYDDSGTWKAVIDAGALFWQTTKYAVAQTTLSMATGTNYLYLDFNWTTLTASLKVSATEPVPSTSSFQMWFYQITVRSTDWTIENDANPGTNIYLVGAEGP